MKRWLLLLATTCLLATHGTAQAALTVYLDLPGVNGESNAPGRADVIALDSLSLTSSSLAATKLLDSTSPALATALVTGTPYASASLLFYDAVATDTQPDAQLVLNTALVSSIQSLSLGGNPGESVSFAFAAPSLSLYLELPGVTGESSAPGHPGVIALDAISLFAGGFSVTKSLDSTSPGLAAALVGGTPNPTATLLFYSNVVSQGAPDFSLVYGQSLVSSIVATGSQERPKEDVSFVSAGVTAPEPAIALLLGAALAGAGCVAVCNRARELDAAP
jgi:type VI protein secretion system component Hcp